MKIGTLKIEIYGEFLFLKSVDNFFAAMDPVFLSVCDDFDSDYRRFAFYAAVLTFVIPLKIFWKNDIIYKTMVKQLDKCFANWSFDIILNINEKGG